MIKIPPVKEEVIAKYLEEAKPIFKAFLKKISGKALYRPLTNYLKKPGSIRYDEKKIDALLVGDRSELQNVIAGVNAQIGKTKYTNELFSKFSYTDSYRSLAENLDVTICPYCNRSFIFSLGRGKLVKPEYDHYFPRDFYSYLGISLFNFVPCCSLCNRSKSNKNPNTTSIIYPYEEEFGDQVFFDLKYNNPTDLVCRKHPVTIEIKSSVTPQPVWLPNSKDKIFKLDGLYKKHSEYVKDIIELTMVYSKKRLSSLYKEFSWLHRDGIESLKEVLYVNYAVKNKWHKKILSKLTYDIVNRFEEH